MTWYYYGVEMSGEREIRNLKILKNNPKLLKKDTALVKFTNLSTIVLLGVLFFGVTALTIWGLTWVFQDGFNIWAILFNPAFIVFAIVFLGISAGRTR